LAQNFHILEAVTKLISQAEKDNNMRQKFRNKGFTLIELLIVIVIIGLGVTLTIPFVSQYSQNASLRSDAQAVYGLMQNAKMLAIKQHQDARIFFDTASNPNKLHMLSSRGANGTWDNGGDDTQISSYILSKGNSFGHGNATVAIGASFGVDNVTFAGNAVDFNSRGTVTGAGYAYISNRDGNTYAVGALTTGLIMLRHWNGSSWE